MRYFAQHEQENEDLGRRLDMVLNAHCDISLHMYQMSLLDSEATVSVKTLHRREQLGVGLHEWLAAQPEPEHFPAQYRRFYHYLR